MIMKNLIILAMLTFSFLLYSCNNEQVNNDVLKYNFSIEECELITVKPKSNLFDTLLVFNYNRYLVYNNDTTFSDLKIYRKSNGLESFILNGIKKSYALEEEYKSENLTSNIKFVFFEYMSDYIGFPIDDNKEIQIGTDIELFYIPKSNQVKIIEFEAFIVHLNGIKEVKVDSNTEKYFEVIIEKKLSALPIRFKKYYFDKNLVLVRIEQYSGSYSSYNKQNYNDIKGVENLIFEN